MRLVFETDDDLRLLRRGDKLDHRVGGHDAFYICRADVEVTEPAEHGVTGIAVRVIKRHCVGVRRLASDPYMEGTFTALPGELSRKVEIGGEFLHGLEQRSRQNGEARVEARPEAAKQ